VLDFSCKWGLSLQSREGLAVDLLLPIAADTALDATGAD
jgi:hypothetical protein